MPGLVELIGVTFIAVTIMVATFVTGGRDGRFSSEGLIRFLVAALVGVVAIGLFIRRWGRRILAEAAHGYAHYYLRHGTLLDWLAPEAPWTVGWIGWDFSGLWVLQPDGQVKAPPDPRADPPGVYPSPNRPGAWELWIGSQWFGHFPKNTACQ